MYIPHIVMLCIGQAVVCIAALLTHSTLAYKVTNKNHLS